MNKKWIGVALLAAMLPAGFASAASVGSNDINDRVNAGGELSRMQDYLEREMVAREISEQREKAKAEIEKQEEEARHTSEVSFYLNRLNIEESKVLSQDELAIVKAKYEGREVSLNDLYEAVDAINRIYENRGYFTCRAFLKPQKIEGGVVFIDLAESTVGRVVLEGNRNTDKNYIRNRLPLKEGTIPSIHQLNKEQLRFNGSNDAQLRIVLKAGEAVGTTDYYITVKEPKNSSWTLFTDNMGSSLTSEYRLGLFYNNRSLSGRRNALMLGTVVSRGTAAVSAMYTHPVGRSGGKLNFSVNYNRVRQIKNTDITKTTGHALSFGVGYTLPLSVTETFRSELSLDFRRQKSVTDCEVKKSGRPFSLVDDTVTDFSAGLAMTQMWDRAVFYRKHTLTFGRSSSDSLFANDSKRSKKFAFYKFSMFYQKYYGRGQNFSIRLDGQYSFQNNLANSRLFYLGGMYSIRGYAENYISGDSGVALSLEYGLPISKDRKVRGFVFLDYGRTFGESGESSDADRYLVSTGLGVRAQLGNNVSGTVSFGFPLKRNFDGKVDRVSLVRVNFTLSAQF